MIQHAEDDDEDEDGGDAEFFFDCSPLGSIKMTKIKTSWFGI